MQSATTVVEPMQHNPGHNKELATKICHKEVSKARTARPDEDETTPAEEKVTPKRKLTVSDREASEGSTVKRDGDHVGSPVIQPITKAGTVDQVNTEALYKNILTQDQRKPLGPSVVVPWKRALMEAEKVVENIETAHKLVIFGDGSAIPNEHERVPMVGAYSVVLSSVKDESVSWHDSAWSAPRVYESVNTELLAIVEGLSIAKYLRHTSPNWSDRKKYLPIVILTDNQEAMRLVQRGQDLVATELEICLFQPIVTAIISLMHDLNGMNSGTKIQYVPAHTNVVPHELADEAAKRSASRGLLRQLMPDWTADMLMGDEAKGIPAYEPIGRALQEKVLEIGLRHPGLDEEGKKLSKRGAI